MEAWLLKVGGGALDLPAGVDLVARGGGVLPQAMPTIALDGDRLFVGGSPSDDAGAIDALRAKGTQFPGVAPPPWILAVDGATPWGEVAPMVSDAADSGNADVVLVFGRTLTEPAPARSAISPELDRIQALADPSDRAMAMVGTINTVFGTCKPILRAFGEAAAVPVEEKHAWLAHQVATGLGACGCESDMASVRSLGWVLWGPGDGEPVSAVQVRFSTAAEAVEIALPAATPWKEAAERVIAASAGGKSVKAVAK